jgi:hypothetical protein
VTTDLPRFDINGILRRRDRIVDRVIVPRIGELLQLDALQQMTAELQRVLPSGITRATLFESIRHIAGRTVQRPNGTALAWRLAGNIPRLREGVPASPWSAQLTEEWVPLQILRATPCRNQRNRIGYNYEFRVLAGSPCPMRLTAFWAKELSRAMARRMGFSKPWGHFPYKHAVDLVGLRLLGQLDPQRSTTSPAFYEVACPAAFQKWNRDHVLRVRCRVDPCPRGWTHSCRTCLVGYANCPAATHPQDYVRGFCAICGNPDVWFDPAAAVGRCIQCHTRELMKRFD